MNSKSCCMTHIYNIQKVLPAIYDDSLSYYEVLCKVQYALEELCKFAHEIDDEQGELTQTVEGLIEEFNEFKEHGFDDYYRQMIQAWVDANMERIIHDAVKMVWFGLTLDGYFIAYIPDSWEEIIFDTGAVYSEPSYGCLMLKWESPNGGVVDEQNLYNQAAIRLGRIERTLYTAISEGGE